VRKQPSQKPAGSSVQTPMQGVRTGWTVLMRVGLKASRRQ
jgi:hypothetical protein